LAIKELTEEAFGDIERAYENMVTAHAAESMPQFIEAHRRFHLSIAVASGNSLFERLAR